MSRILRSSLRWSSSPLRVVAVAPRAPASAKKPKLKVDDRRAEADPEEGRPQGQGQGPDQGQAEGQGEVLDLRLSRSCKKLTRRPRSAPRRQAVKAHPQAAHRQGRRARSRAARRARSSSAPRAPARRSVELKRNTKDCKPRPIDLSQAADCDFIGAQDRLAVPAAVPRRLLHGHRQDARATGQARQPHRRRRCRRTRTACRSRRRRTTLNDGFSPGQVITLRVPGLDNPRRVREDEPAAAQRAQPQRRLDEARSRSSSSTRRPASAVPIWVELDSNATHDPLQRPRC